MYEVPAKKIDVRGGERDLLEMGSLAIELPE